MSEYRNSIPKEQIIHDTGNRDNDQAWDSAFQREALWAIAERLEALVEMLQPLHDKLQREAREKQAAVVSQAQSFGEKRL